MNTITFQSVLPSKNLASAVKEKALSAPLFSGSNSKTGEASLAPLMAVQANFMPVLFGARRNSENSLRKALKELGVPEMTKVLNEAKKLADEKGHSQVTALHLLATQFNEMLNVVDFTSSLSEQGSFIQGQLDEPRSLWNAHFATVQEMSTAEEVFFHLKRSATRVNKAVSNLELNKIGDKKAVLSQELIDVLTDRVNLMKGYLPTEQDMLADTQVQVDKALTPETVQALEHNKNLLDNLKKAMEEQFPELVEELNAYDYRALVDYSNFVTIGELYSELEKQVEAKEKKPEDLPLQPVDGEGNALGDPIPYEKIPDYLNSLQTSFMEKIAGKALAEHSGEEMAALNIQLDKLFQIPFEAVGFAIQKGQVFDAIEVMAKDIESLRLQTEEAYRLELEDITFSRMITGGFDGEVAPKYLRTEETAKAHHFYTDLLKTLTDNDGTISESPEHYLMRAEANGAGDAELAHLTKMLTSMKMLRNSLEQGMKPVAEGGASRPSSPTLYQDLSTVTGLVKAYSQINWAEIENKVVDLQEAKQTLDSNRLIPPPVRGELMNFLKQGNKNNWKSQPLLVLVGGYGTSLVKKEVTNFLKDVLPMNYYQAKGSHEGKLTTTELGTLTRESQLSVPAKALIHNVELARQNDTIPNPSPSTLVNLGSILNFLEHGGFEQFESFMSAENRREFEEPEFTGITMDLSPYAFVGSVDDQGVLEYLDSHYGDSFNYKDWSIISLGEDIDIFTKIKVAETEIAPAIEKEYNVKFEKGAVKNIVTHWAIAARHDAVKDILLEAARVAQGKTGSTELQMIPADIETLEKEYLGSTPTSFLNKPMLEDTVGSVNALAAIGHGGGAVMRMGIYSSKTFNRKKEGGQLAKMTHVLGPVGEMAKDSSVKATELLTAIVSSLANQTTGGGSVYKIFDNMTKGHELIVNWPEDVDGPSAGAAMSTAAISRLTGIPVRHDVAMTGTIADGLLVGEIGGIFNKISAAYVAGTTSGIKTILMPRASHIEMLRDHPQFVEKLKGEGVKLIGVETIDEVLKKALVDYDRLHELSIIPEDDEDEDPLSKILKAVTDANKESAKTAQAMVPEIVAAVLKQLNVRPDLNLPPKEE